MATASIVIKHHPVTFMYNDTVTVIPVDLEDDHVDALLGQHKHSAHLLVLNSQSLDKLEGGTPKDGYILFREIVYRVCPSSKEMTKLTGPVSKPIKKRMLAAH